MQAKATAQQVGLWRPVTQKSESEVQLIPALPSLGCSNSKSTHGSILRPSPRCSNRKETHENSRLALCMCAQYYWQQFSDHDLGVCPKAHMNMLDKQCTYVPNNHQTKLMCTNQLTGHMQLHVCPIVVRPRPVGDPQTSQAV